MADFINSNIKVFENSKYEVLTPNGFKDFKGLIKGKNYTLRIELETGKKIECTPEHKLFNNKGVIYAKDLMLNDIIETKDGFERVVGIDDLNEVVDVYELLQVDGDNTYYTNDIKQENCLFLDEFAFVPNNIADDFMASVYPTIVTGKTSKIIIASTPNGMNHFYHIWREAVKGENNFRPIKVNWWEVPGRDEAFKERTIKDIGIVRWNQEFLARFLGSTSTLIDSDLLERMGQMTKDPTHLSMGDLLYVYERPELDKMYIMGVDTAKGTGGDYSVIQVLKINDEHDIDHVATYRCNTIAPHDFAQVCISVSQYYNGCYMMVENNDVGGQVADSIWYEYEYDKIVNVDKKGIGVRATRKSKLAANMLMKRYLESGWLDIKDNRTVYEFGVYEEIRPDIFQAPRTEHDDCITSLLWGLYFVTTPYFDGKNMKVKTIDPKYRLDGSPDEDLPIMMSDSVDYDYDEDGFNWGTANDDGSFLPY